MEPEQVEESSAGQGEVPLKDESSPAPAIILDAVRLMGHTVGLTQRACLVTGAGVVAAGRRAGRLLAYPSKLRLPPVRGRERIRAGRPRSRVGRARRGREGLHASIGETICKLAQVDPSSLLKDLELKKSLSAVLDRVVGAESLTQGTAGEMESLLSDLKDARTRAEAASTAAGALESDLASTKRELDEARRQAEEMQSRLSSQLGELRSEKESLLSDLKDARTRAEVATSRAETLEEKLSRRPESSGSAGSGDEPREPAPEQGRSGQRAEAENAVPLSEESSPSPQEGACQPDEGPDAGVEAAESPLRTAGDEVDEVLSPPGVTLEEVSEADFAGAAERLMFSKALSGMDMTNKEAASRAGAVKLMGGIPHPLSVRALVAQLGRETSAEVREECILALTALEAQEGLPAAEEALKDEAASVRLAAVRAIYRLAGPEGAPKLVPMLQDPDEDVRRRAAMCLGWLGHKSLSSELLPLLRDGSAAVRRAALEALGNLKSSAVLDRIIELLDDPEPSVQREASQALGTITGERMGETFPEDEEGRRFLIARWRAWLEKASPAGSTGMLQPSA